MGSIQAMSAAFQSGGIWMWAILAVQIASVVIIIERVMSLYLRKNPNQRRLVQAFEADIKNGDMTRVMGRAQSYGNQSLALAVQAGAQAAMDMGGRDEIQSRMDEVLMNENEKFEKRTGFLAMLGNVGTLLGLLGTILGLIQAFASVANVNPIEKAAALTQGIAMAMNTTAYGLIMAIPALIMYAVLQNRANALSEDLNQAALRAFNWLSYSYETTPQRKIRSKKESF